MLKQKRFQKQIWLLLKYLKNARTLLVKVFNMFYQELERVMIKKFHF